MKTAFLVVMYNREIHAAATIQALLNANVFFNESPLIIWNNGPDLLKNKDCDDLIPKRTKTIYASKNSLERTMGIIETSI